MPQGCSNESGREERYPSQIVPSAVERFLGPPQFFNLEAERRNEVGVATAVAWTENGGEIMPVEVLIMEGKGNLQITGQDRKRDAGVGSGSIFIHQITLLPAQHKQRGI